MIHEAKGCLRELFIVVLDTSECDGGSDIEAVKLAGLWSWSQRRGLQTYQPLVSVSAIYASCPSLDTGRSLIRR